MEMHAGLAGCLSGEDGKGGVGFDFVSVDVCVCVCLTVSRWGGWRGAVGVDVTPTPAKAPDPEQMARQGLSAEPELIACAMSHCLRQA